MHRSKWTAIAAAALLAGGVGVSGARASSTSIRSVPVATANENGTLGATAITNDPTLANRVYNALSVTVPPGSDWTNSEIRITLTQGNVYNAAAPAGTDASPSGPALWSVPAFSPGAYDTFVNSKGLGAATILGTLNADGSAGPPPAVGLGNTTPQATSVSVAWGNTTGGEEGTFQIGQFVLSADAVGSFFGHTYSSDQPNGAFHTFQGNILAGSMGAPVPEPTGLTALMLAGAGMLLRRRRTS